MLFAYFAPLAVNLCPSNSHRHQKRRTAKNAKHAKASRVEIDLRHSEKPGGLPQVTIRDNGRGFDPTDLPLSGHYGLGMMRERAEAVGAMLTITSQPGQGSEVFIRWPEKEIS